MAFSSGSGYDLHTTTWSPEGRVYQVEYALKHIDSKGALSLGLCCKDGVVLASQVELVHDTVKYPSPSFNVIHAVDDNLFISFCGMRPDGNFFVERARVEADNWRERFGFVISAETLANRLALFVSQFTEYYGYRPFGASIFIASYAEDKPALFTLNPAGEVSGYFACALGAEKQAAKTDLELLIPPENITVEEGTYKLIKILKKSFDENTSKKIELQVGVVSQDNPKVTLLDHATIKELEKRADEELEAEDDDDDDDEDEEDEEDEEN